MQITKWIEYFPSDAQYRPSLWITYRRSYVVIWLRWRLPRIQVL